MPAPHTKKLFDDYYERLKERPEEWRTTAENLKAGAEVLFQMWSVSRDETGEPIHLEHIELIEPACFLYSCYLETLLKGYLITMDGSFQAAVKAHSGPWKGHHLHDLALATKYPLTANQKSLLRTAAAWVRWAGRYPISLNRFEFTIPKQFGAGDHVTPIYLQIDERNELEPFCEFLINGIHENHMAYLEKRPVSQDNS